MEFGEDHDPKQNIVAGRDDTAADTMRSEDWNFECNLYNQHETNHHWPDTNIDKSKKFKKNEDDLLD